jgi:hypothetical protein
MVQTKLCRFLCTLLACVLVAILGSCGGSGGGGSDTTKHLDSPTKPGYQQGNGVGEVTFQVYAVSGNTAHVESTMIRMVSADQQRVLAAVQIPLDYTYFQ